MSLVDKPALQAMNDAELFNEINENKRCFARLAYLRRYLNGMDDSQTKHVLADWIKLIDKIEYYGEEGLSVQGITQVDLRYEYNAIGNSMLSEEQKQIIKDYYLAMLPFLANPANQNNNGYNNGNNNNIIPPYNQPYYGGKRKQRKTRSKKTRKHKSRKH